MNTDLLSNLPCITDGDLTTFGSLRSQIKDFTLLPSDVVIYKILPFIEFELKVFNVKDLYGYFEDDIRIYPIWNNIIINNNSIKKLVSYPPLTSLYIHKSRISELKEYPLLSSLIIEGYYDAYSEISELKEYPLLTSLYIQDCEISELKEYPLLTSLKIYDSKISKLKEYPLFVYLFTILNV